MSNNLPLAIRKKVRPENISPTPSLYQQLPQWFIAIVGLSYVSGYLIEFTYYASFGIVDAAGEIFKLKYIQTGIIFLLLCAILGVYTIMLSTPLLNASVREAVRGGLYLTRWTVGAAAFSVLSIYLAALLTPLPHIETMPQGAGSILLVATLVIYAVTLAYLIERRYRESYLTLIKETSGKLSRPQIHELCLLWRRTTCLKNATSVALLVATAIIDALAFWGKMALLGDLFVRGGWIFLFFAICMPLLLLRVVDRLGQVRRIEDRNRDFRQHLIQSASSVVFVLLLFLVLISYSYCVFPFIPNVKGGADYEEAPLILINLKDKELNNLITHLQMGAGQQELQDVVLIYSTTSSYYFAKPQVGNNPCDWRIGQNRPIIMQLRRDQISAQSFKVKFTKPPFSNCHS